MMCSQRVGILPVVAVVIGGRHPVPSETIFKAEPTDIRSQNTGRPSVVAKYARKYPVKVTTKMEAGVGEHVDMICRPIRIEFKGKDPYLPPFYGDVNLCM
jgi:hypothetical protein